MMHEENKTMISVVAAFLIGGLIGAGVALLMAPQSGDKTRSMIADKSSEIKERAKHTAEEARSRATDKLDDLKNQAVGRASDMKDLSGEMIRDKKGKLESEVRAARKTISY